MVIGKIFASRVLSRRGVVSVLRGIWSTEVAPCVREVGDNMYGVSFRSEKEMNRANEEGPWSVMGNSMSFKKWTPGVVPSELQFKTINFWVQVHKLPIEMITRSNADIIGSKLGRIIHVEEPITAGGLGRNFLRIRIELCVDNALVSGFWVPRRNLEKIWGEVKYEHLSDFCYGCGKLGHVVKNCSEYNGIEHVESKFKYSPFMRAAPARSVSWFSVNRNVGDKAKLEDFNKVEGSDVNSYGNEIRYSSPVSSNHDRWEHEMDALVRRSKGKQLVGGSGEGNMANWRAEGWCEQVVSQNGLVFQKGLMRINVEGGLMDEREGCAGIGKFIHRKSGVKLESFPSQNEERVPEKSVDKEMIVHIAESVPLGVVESSEPVHLDMVESSSINSDDGAPGPELEVGEHVSDAGILTPGPYNGDAFSENLDTQNNHETVANLQNNEVSSHPDIHTQITQQQQIFVPEVAVFENTNTSSENGMPLTGLDENLDAIVSRRRRFDRVDRQAEKFLVQGLEI
ncbi:hypothetical protein COLO4_22586 [Corchorus olitorius]|uniref:CCHC-type domain-containing protein n=1 Tax=Corchorus olitorius TaxID=93759 RepID=A0A1R3IL91_9ROSI|nr:hypothetical protein COLO4_22586 [Corchorus olitorius]